MEKRVTPESQVLLDHQDLTENQVTQDQEVQMVYQDNQVDQVKMV